MLSSENVGEYSANMQSQLLFQTPNDLNSPFYIKPKQAEVVKEETLAPQKQESKAKNEGYFVL